MTRVAAAIALVAFLLLVGGGGRPARAADPTPSARVPASIDRTGTKDVTAALQRFFDSVPDGSQIEMGKGARYRVDGTLTLTDRHDLLIDGNGATIAARIEGDRDRAHIRLEGGSDIHIRYLKIVGANAKAGVEKDAYRTDRVGQQGFDLHGVNGVELDHVTVTMVYGDTVYLGRSQDGTWSSGVWIHDSLLVGTGRHGITVTAGRDVIIERNYIGNTRFSTIDLEPNAPSWGARDIYIAHNTIGPGRLLFLSANGAGPVDNVVVLENKLQGRRLSVEARAPAGVRRAGYFFVGNTSDTLVRGTPFVLQRLDDVTIRYNIQPIDPAKVATGSVGVSATDICGLEVTGNDFGPQAPTLKVTGRSCPPQAPEPVPAPPVIAARDDPTSPPETLPAGSSVPVPPTTAPADTSSERPTVDPTVALLAVGVAIVTLAALALGLRQLRAGPPDEPSDPEVP